MYEIIFFERAEKQFKKLPFEIRERISNVLERIKIRPLQFDAIKKLVNSNYYRLRVGDYRIILDIQQNKLIVFVIELGHRKNIYK